MNDSPEFSHSDESVAPENWHGKEEPKRRSFTTNDLLIASLFSAVLFAMRKIQVDSTWGRSGFTLAFDVVAGVVYGFSLVALVRVIRSGISPFWLSRLRHPGHWILIESACYAATTFATFFPHVLFGEGWMNFEANQFSKLAPVASSLAMLVAWTMAAWRLPSRWRVFFMILATQALLQFATGLSFLQIVSSSVALAVAGEWIRPLAIGWLIYVLLRDRRLGVTHDWMHWAGVGGWLMLNVATIIIVQLMTLFFVLNGP